MSRAGKQQCTEAREDRGPKSAAGCSAARCQPERKLREAPRGQTKLWPGGWPKGIGWKGDRDFGEGLS